jgi:hypothetical protein
MDGRRPGVEDDAHDKQLRNEDPGSERPQLLQSSASTYHTMRVRCKRTYISSPAVSPIMTITHTRRTFLTLSGATLITATAGCAGVSGDESPTVTTYNGFDHELAVTLSVYHTTDESLATEETLTLAAGESQQIPNPMTNAGTYEIRVIVEDTFDESYEWTVSENGPPSLYLDIQPNGMELSDAGR